MSGDATIVRDNRPESLASEEHFSIVMIAETWEISTRTARELFENEPGVLRLGSTRSNGKKRRYVTLKVPRSVLERVHRRLEARGSAR